MTFSYIYLCFFFSLIYSLFLFLRAGQDNVDLWLSTFFTFCRAQNQNLHKISEICDATIELYYPAFPAPHKK